MKQADLIRRLRDGARTAGTSWEFVRHGAAHDIYSFGGRIVPIPRHREISEKLAKGILRELGL